MQVKPHERKNSEKFAEKFGGRKKKFRRGLDA